MKNKILKFSVCIFLFNSFLVCGDDRELPLLLNGDEVSQLEASVTKWLDKKIKEMPVEIKKRLTQRS